MNYFDNFVKNYDNVRNLIVNELNVFVNLDFYELDQTTYEMFNHSDDYILDLYNSIGLYKNIPCLLTMEYLIELLNRSGYVVLAYQMMKNYVALGFNYCKLNNLEEAEYDKYLNKGIAFEKYYDIINSSDTYQIYQESSKDLGIKVDNIVNPNIPFDIYKAECNQLKNAKVFTEQYPSVKTNFMNGQKLDCNMSYVTLDSFSVYLEKLQMITSPKTFEMGVSYYRTNRVLEARMAKDFVVVGKVLNADDASANDCRARITNNTITDFRCGCGKNAAEPCEHVLAVCMKHNAYIYSALKNKK